MLQWFPVVGNQSIRLEVPGVLGHRDLVLRTVSAACKLLAIEVGIKRPAAGKFSAHVVSAVGEAFNNIALHGYRGREPDIIRLDLTLTEGAFRVDIQDFGNSFDPDSAQTPDLDALPESGLGVFIIRSFMDEVTYTPGSPNTLSLVKHIEVGARAVEGRGRKTSARLR